jgi:quercetin dioxygenase-like cupin family protein
MVPCHVARGIRFKLREEGALVVPKTKPKRASRKAGVKKAALRGTVTRKGSAKPILQHVPWASVELEDLNPQLRRHFVVGKDIMLARVLLKKGCIVPEHSHHNEQVTYILEGALKFWINSKEIVVNAGEVLTIPPDMPHKAEALEDTVDLDVFHPPRADWINKTDQYLRRGK